MNKEDSWSLKDANPYGKRGVSAFTLVLCLVMSFLTGLGLWLVNGPVEYPSMTFWIGAVLMGLPLLGAIEASHWMYDRKFVSKLPGSLRILYGVIIGLAELLILGVIVFFLSSLVAF
ncbi:hypothetical protein [Hahella sp. HN01]|uniref:hypothetical protein n=1 Tax=unclassified Hahella TaxID=2624107 RepID=UPI001C1EB23F|nr:hypothetical protein [Hahella sp. HN01]MBU6954024.1 hypothetical protein [Hahella sp. HN01]